MNNPIVPTIEHNGRVLVVTSETIAQGAGVQHKNVLEMIAKHSDQIKRFGPIAFETRPLPGGGNPIRVALLSEQQSTLVMSFMRNTDKVIEFKVSLVDAFFKMAERINNAMPLTEDEIVHRALEIQTNKVLALSSKLEAIQPKADYVDTFVADEDLITFRTLASDLEVGERDLRDALIYSGWIYSQTKSRWSNSKEKLIPVTRYSAMADKKQYFQAVLNHDVPRFGGEVMHTLKVTAPGASAIARLLIRLANQYGSFEESIIPLETRYNEKKAS